MTFISDNFFSIVISSVCIIVSYIGLNYYRRLTVKMVKREPETLPFIGNIHYLLQARTEGILNFVLKFGEKYSSPIRFWLGSKLYIVLYESDEIKTILQSDHCLNKSEMYKFFKPLFGTGLLTTPGSKWIHRRKMLEPGFNRNMLQNFFDTFVEQSLLLTEELEKVGLNGNEISLHDDMLRCTINIAIANMTGVKLELQSDLINVTVEIFTRYREILRYRLNNIIMYPDIIFNYTNLGRELREKRNILNSLIDEIIKRGMNASKLDATKAKGKTFIDIVMKATHGEQYYDEAITLLATASETIATVMHFTVFMLASFSEVQEKIFKELSEIYDMKTPKSTLIKYEDLQNMHYLERVIKETMRIFPAVPLLGRQLEEDIKIGGNILPKGADVILLLLKLNRDEKYWPNPLVFDPNRFLSENLAKSSWPYYVPFSSGRRNCIGMKYGIMAMKVILANLVRTFIFEINEKIEIDQIKLDTDMVIHTDKPLKVKIRKR